MQAIKGRFATRPPRAVGENVAPRTNAPAAKHDAANNQVEYHADPTPCADANTKHTKHHRTAENVDCWALLRTYLMKEILHKAFHVSQVAQDFPNQLNHIGKATNAKLLP